MARDRQGRHSARVAAENYAGHVQRALGADKALSAGERAILSAHYAQIQATFAVLDALDEIAERLPAANMPVTVSGLDEVRVMLEDVAQALHDRPPGR
jgi:uncharacterized protein involved in propanediol utilization